MLSRGSTSMCQWRRACTHAFTATAPSATRRRRNPSATRARTEEQQAVALVDHANPLLSFLGQQAAEDTVAVFGLDCALLRDQRWIVGEPDEL